ncbi:hypothetical protein L6164_012271 [Bauhinia variegata]|uniref:Uncharacterized protein n=1 Tax=Bauhinia variegata TaxID=167791 RepID=A0ACB9P9D2_BAUVA|nr:hypothetical protein L6164_012271 [Bauhinia variegata]
MNRPDFSSDGSAEASSKRDLQLQGPRPPPLRVSKESHKISKPPRPPAAANQPAPAAPRQPVIIYSVSPKVIHATVNDFMSIVQRLTGPSSGSETAHGSGDVSPAARLASIERTSPTENERVRSGDDSRDILESEGLDVSQFPGILSPAPGSLPAISSGFFSPVIDPQMLSFLYDTSPLWPANGFTASPSDLLSATVVSPLPSPDLFDLFDYS